MSAAKGFEPSLLDKLLDTAGGVAGQASLRRFTVDDVKESVARDLEALLNSRIMHGDEALAGFPECKTSVLTFGVRDFAGLSLASSYDRAYVCRSIEQAIARHESRLREVRVALEVDEQATSVLRFGITALLIVSSAREPVSFDAFLQPSTLQYSVSKARRAAPAHS